MFLIFVVTVIAAGTSFLCSLMEAALYAIPPGKIEELRRQGHVGGVRLARLREKVDEPISAILTLNTIANTVGATVAGALVGHHYGDVAVAVYSGIFTLIILIISEIIPKTLGVTYADRLAPSLSLPMVTIIKGLFPFVLLSQRITHSIRKNVSEESSAPSEEEILALAEMGARAGTLLPEEARWAINALRLNDVTAGDLMTPRTVVYMLSADLPLNEVKEHSEHWTYSRLPVVKDNDPDQVEGVVHRRDVFDMLVHSPREELERTTLRDLMHPVVLVPKTVKCHELLKRFLEDRQHLICVTNEYGGIEGVISLEDVLEYLLGEEIVDLHDQHIDMQDVARQKAERRLQKFRMNRGARNAGDDTDQDLG
ncbi:hemolysin family protein [bacterium]|nr:hemolysin family protein [bacterium]